MKRLSAICLLLPAYVTASNGAYDIGWGVKSRGMGGASAAYAQESFAAITNPATLSELENRIDVNGGYLYHTQSIEVKDVPELLQEFGVRNAKYPINGSRNLVYGAAGYTKKVNEEVNIGLFVTPQSGGIFRIQKPKPPITEGRPFFTGEYERLFYSAITPCISYRPCWSNHTIGLGIDFTGAAVNFKNFDNLGQGVFGYVQVQNTSAHPNHITDKGWAYAWGMAARIGWLWDATPNFKVGLSYRTKTFMSRLKKYEGLMTPNGWSQLPEVLTAGFSWRFMPCATVAFDVARIFNHRVPALANHVNIFDIDLSGALPVPSLANPHGSNGGAAFGWRSQTVYKVGLAYDLNCDWTLRLGYNYSKNPVPRLGTFSSVFVSPAVIEHHLTLGGTWQCTPRSELSFCYVHGFKNTRRGTLTGPAQPAAAEALFNLTSITTLLTCQTDQIEIQYGYCF